MKTGAKLSNHICTKYNNNYNVISANHNYTHNLPLNPKVIFFNQNRIRKNR